jgi:hypothetical protein
MAEPHNVNTRYTYASGGCSAIHLLPHSVHLKLDSTSGLPAGDVSVELIVTEAAVRERIAFGFRVVRSNEINAVYPTAF